MTFFHNLRIVPIWVYPSYVLSDEEVGIGRPGIFQRIRSGFRKDGNAKRFWSKTWRFQNVIQIYSCLNDNSQEIQYFTIYLLPIKCFDINQVILETNKNTQSFVTMATELKQTHMTGNWMKLMAYYCCFSCILLFRTLFNLKFTDPFLNALFWQKSVLFCKTGEAVKMPTLSKYFHIQNSLYLTTMRKSIFHYLCIAHE